MKTLVTVGCSAAILYFLEPTFGKLRIERNAMFDNYKPQFCDKHLHNLLYEVGKRLDIKEEKLKSIVLYYSNNIDPECYGGLNNRSTPSIGLPASFEVKTFDELKGVEQTNKNIKWDEGSGFQLKKSMLLNDDEKKFVLAQQLYMLDNYNLGRLNYILNTCLLFSTIGISNIVLKKTRKLKDLGIVAVIMTSVFIGKVFTMSNLKHYFESEADFFASYVTWRSNEAAMSYFKKCIMRNKALAEIQKSQNLLVTYNEDGSSRFSFFTYHDRINLLENNRIKKPAPIELMKKLELDNVELKKRLYKESENLNLPLDN